MLSKHFIINFDEISEISKIGLSLALPFPRALPFLALAEQYPGG